MHESRRLRSIKCTKEEFLTCKIFLPSSIRLGGITVSNESKSFENLFNILPIGVVSKNDIGSRKMLPSNRSWRMRAARNVPLVTNTDEPNMNIAEILKSTALVFLSLIYYYFWENFYFFLKRQFLYRFGFFHSHIDIVWPTFYVNNLDVTWRHNFPREEF